MLLHRQRIGRTRSTALRLLVALGYGVVSSLTRLAILAARPLIVLLLRQLVRNRSFWERGLRGAWSRKVGCCGSGLWLGMGWPPARAVALETGIGVRPLK